MPVTPGMTFILNKFRRNEKKALIKKYTFINFLNLIMDIQLVVQKNG